MTPHLADVSGRLFGLSDSDDPGRPLSSTSARSLAATAAAKQRAATAKPAADYSREASRIAAIKREYLQIDVKKLWHIKTTPAADKEDSGRFTSALISSMRRTMRNILELADACGEQCFESTNWVDGWQTPLREALHRSISRRSPDIAASSTQIIDCFLSAIDSDRARDKRAPLLFGDLERCLIE